MNKVVINWQGEGWYSFSGTDPVIGVYRYPPSMTSGDVTYEESRLPSSSRQGTCRYWSEDDYLNHLREQE